MFERPKFSARVPAARSALVLQIAIDTAKRFQPRLSVNDCRDPKDNKYLELALEAQADVIVSSDQDLLVLNAWRGIPIITSAEFVRRYSSTPSAR